jgi:PleD family two-component response regulator
LELSPKEDRARIADILQTVLKNGKIHAFEKICTTKDGKLLIFTASIAMMPDQKRFLISVTDITKLKEYEKKLEAMAYYDPLTGLANRILQADPLNQAILQVNRHGSFLAVVYLDLDGFRDINDTYGHAIGDKLLIKVASQMQNVLRQCDSLARVGGDEFIAVLSDLENHSHR